MYGVKDIVNLFTDRFIGGKEEGSNLYSLMSVYSDELLLLKETNDRIMDWRNIDNAEGKALDLIGKDLRKPRGNNADAAYRIILKTKVAQNLANGTINGLINAIAYVLQIDKKEIEITELWGLLKMPATLAIESIPMSKIEAANLTTDEFEEILQALVGAGIKLMLLATGLNEYLQYYVRPYMFRVDYKITGRFRTGRVAATTALDPNLHFDGIPYDFNIDYPITNRFRSEKVSGTLVETDFGLGTSPYDFNIDYAMTGLFGTAASPGALAEVSVQSEAGAYDFEMRSRATGRFTTGGRRNR